MAHEPDPAAKESLAALLGALIADAKDLLVRELRLAQLEVRQNVRTTARAARASGAGGGLALAGGLLLLVMVVHLVAAQLGLPLWGCYGLLGGGLALAGGGLIARRNSHPHAGEVGPPQGAGTATEQAVSRRGRSTAPALGRVGQRDGSVPALNVTALWGLLKGTFTQWNEDKPFQLAAALSYYTLFSLAPLLIIAIAVAGLVFGQEAAQHQIVGAIQGIVGRQSAEAIQEMIKNAGTRGAGITATLLGVGTLLIGAGGVVGQLQDSLNTIWGVAPKPGLGILGLLRARFFSLAMVVGLGFLLLVSLLVSAALTVALQFLGAGGESVLWQGVEFLVSVGVSTLLIALIYKVLPDVHMAWRDVCIGAAVTALLFTLGKFLIGLYLGSSATESAYGAAGSLVVVLLWVYYSALIFFFGAEFTQVYATTYGAGVTPDEHAVAVTDKHQSETEGVPPQGKGGGGHTGTLH